MTVSIQGVDVAAGGVEAGVITIWSGLIANIPSGWVICDGNSGTPNLLTRFVQGVATAATNPGATGGAATVTLATADIPAHTHVRTDGSTTATLADRYATSAAGSQTTTTGSTGGGGAHQNEPTFYDVAFIMKT